MMYNEVVEHCFFSPKHVGMLSLAQSRTVAYRSGAPKRGDFFDIYLSGDEQGMILKACFKANGNPFLIAAVEWICRQIQGTSITIHPFFSYTILVQQLAIPKLHYSVALQVEEGYCEVIQLMKTKLEQEDL